jgi:hypothetical protein
VKITRLLVLVAFMGIFSSVALADGTDPVMKLGGGGGSLPLTTFSFSFNFTKTSSTQNSVTFDFINNTGFVIGEVDLLATGTGLGFSCDNTDDIYFNTCTPTTTTPSPATISYFGLDGTHFGIPFATEVTCDEDGVEVEEFVDEGSPSCTSVPLLSDFMFTVNVTDMSVGQSFSVAGTLVPTPEAGTLLLTLAGGMLFLLYRRASFAL